MKFDLTYVQQQRQPGHPLHGQDEERNHWQASTFSAPFDLFQGLFKGGVSVASRQKKERQKIRIKANKKRLKDSIPLLRLTAASAASSAGRSRWSSRRCRAQSGARRGSGQYRWCPWSRDCHSDAARGPQKTWKCREKEREAGEEVTLRVFPPTGWLHLCGSETENLQLNRVGKRSLILRHLNCPC